MRNRSMWWLFLFVFGLVIGGIHSMGAWTRPAAAQSAPARVNADSQEAAERHSQCRSMHWRSLVMQQ